MDAPPPTPHPPASPLPRTPRWCRALAALNPAATLFGPVFQREVRSTSRAARTFWGRTSVALVLLVIGAMVYIGAIRNVDRQSGVERLEALQQIAPILALPLAWIQFVLVAFVAQSLTSPAINRERQKRSFPVLATTPLTGAQIIFGTLAARMVQVGILSLITLPFLLAARTFGGLESESVLATAAIIITTGILSGALGILASVLLTKPSSAGSLAFGILLLIAVGPLVLFSILAQTLGRPPSSNWWLIFSPLAAMIGVTTPASRLVGFPPGQIALYSSLCNLALALGAGLLATALVRPLILREAVAEASRAPVKRSRWRKAPAPAPAPKPALSPDPAAETAPRSDSPAAPPVVASAAFAAFAPSRELSDRPVLWRELRQAAFRKTSRLVLTLLLILGGLLWANLEYGWGAQEVIMIASTAVLVVFILLSTNAGSSAVTGEIEQRTWGVLLTTPLTPREILTAKALGTLRRLWILPTAILCTQGVGVLAGTTHPLLLVITACVLLGTAVLLATSGVFFSLVAKRTSGAGSLNFLFAFSLWAGSLILCGLVGWIVQPRGDPWFLGLCLVLNPVFLVGVAAEALTSHRGRFSYNHLDIPGLASNLDVWSYTAVCVGYLIVAVLFSLFLLRLASARWDRWAIRRMA